MPATTILNQEHGHLAQAGKIGAINDRSAATLALDQSRTRQHGEVRRHGVLRDRELAAEVARGDAVRLVTDKESESVEAGCLREGCKRSDSFGRIHRIHIARTIDLCNESRINDICDSPKTAARCDGGVEIAAGTRQVEALKRKPSTLSRRAPGRS
jgi:hypothetical protein